MTRTERPSLNDRLARYFKARPRIWIDGKEIARIAGYAGYRNRITDLRLKRRMPIKNRQRSVRRQGRTWRVSEYALLSRKKAA